MTEKVWILLDIATHTYTSNIMQAKTGRRLACVHPGLHCEFQASLGHRI